MIWGLLIFNLDRFIVSTIKKRNNKWKEIAQATPRIILAIIIAVVISKPLELKLFEKEINQLLLTEKNQMTLDNKAQFAQQFTPEIKQTNQEIAALKNEISVKEKETDALYETHISEAEGRKGTLLIGKGPVYAEKRQKHDVALAELKQLKIANNNKIQVKEAYLANLVTAQKNQEVKTQPLSQILMG